MSPRRSIWLLFWCICCLICCTHVQGRVLNGECSATAVAISVQYVKPLIFVYAPLASALLHEGAAASAPVVSTDCGPVQGIEEDGVWSYKGIPYGKPPLGKLRWQAPVSAKGRWYVCVWNAHVFVCSSRHLIDDLITQPVAAAGTVPSTPRTTATSAFRSASS